MPTVEIGKASIYYETFGDGDRHLVFAHGAGGNAASWWQQVPHFIDRFRIVTFDHRGFGRSVCPDEDLDMSHFVNDLTAIMDKEGMASAQLVCQSMGGWTGLGMALQCPERVERLVMSHTPGGITNDEIAAVGAEAEKVRKPAVPPFGSWAVAPDFHVKNEVASHLYNQIGAFNDPDVRAKIVSGIGRPTDQTKLEAFRTPTLFITAAQDQIFPPAMIEKVAALVPGSKVVNLGDAGHSSYFESPDAFNAALDDFLA